MRVVVLYFGILKDIFDREKATMELTDGETVDGLLRLLDGSAGPAHIASKQGMALQALAVAVNREYATRDLVLRDGDEVALLPPVSGGLEEERD